MSKRTHMSVNRDELLAAWQQALPSTFKQTDKVEVIADPLDQDALRIHVNTAGHNHYEFEYICRYVDPREVQVTLRDIQHMGATVYDPTLDIQNLSEEYTRNIHECAQTLHSLTNP
ncbi:hypothetical protein [Aneurinibacillus migulanus]|uniref:YugN-like family protein n=2 Tax=Aneurinibacillus migulanus TaxID=47500 RepID=A0A0D1XTG4_ANEMI|nr:hypothetical protein [Aneurinibacillus migulanus]KIV55448.1 hypothetical protein TS65_15885 [Aneurinibacillus migulanus]KON90766.1 hypothetical protein AF333_27370 [Aneurinibacillus migulanus]MCP1357940.1 hypothetical protein [Aneurinibacillus migulanus]MED0895349.1 hypothetical protein [Aneurinibacillus migulanus]MED1618005.1 hypothetical protein [Aneurinibacillus migulanus]